MVREREVSTGCVHNSGQWNQLLRWGGEDEENI